MTMIPTTDTLRRAGEILQEIESLQSELAGLFTNGSAAVAAPKRRGRPPGSRNAVSAAASSGSTKRRRTMSSAARAAIAAAQKARWAKFRAEKKGKASG
jgi:hypothetical protein